MNFEIAHKIQIRKFGRGDTKEVAALIFSTYKLFLSKEYFEKRAIQEYLDYYDPEKNSEVELLKRLNTAPIFYVAIGKDEIIGMIRGRKDKIINLYVNGSQHQKGIGRSLVQRFESEAKRLGSKEIKIHASLYATPFYQKLGYKKTTGIRNFHGLKVQPMKKILS
jgi:GNAT superfamily N-acetyltransferase